MKNLSYSFIMIMFFAAFPTTSSFADTNMAHPAVKLVQDTTKNIFSAIEANKDAIKNDSGLLHKLVNDIVLKHFDFDKMSSLVLKSHWSATNNTQKIQFTQQFRLLIIRTYANALVDNTKQPIKYLDPRENKTKTRIIVRTEIEQKGTFPLPLHYKLYLNKDTWQVYDVSIDGISLVTNYKASFANELRKGSIDDLIKTLTTRNLETKPA